MITAMYNNEDDIHRKLLRKLHLYDGARPIVVSIRVCVCVCVWTRVCVYLYRHMYVWVKERRNAHKLLRKLHRKLRKLRKLHRKLLRKLHLYEGVRLIVVSMHTQLVFIHSYAWTADRWSTDGHLALLICVYIYICSYTYTYKYTADRWSTDGHQRWRGSSHTFVPLLSWLYVCEVSYLYVFITHSHTDVSIKYTANLKIIDARHHDFNGFLVVNWY